MFFVFEEKPNVHKMKDMEIAVNYRIDVFELQTVYLV